MDILDEYSPSLEKDQKEKVIKDNFRKIGTAIQFLGAEIVSDVSSRIAQSVSSGTYVELTAFTGSFQSSGGLVIVPIVIFSTVNNANVYFKLLIDDQEKKVVRAGDSAVGHSTTTFFWASQMLAGKHTVKIQATGVATVGGTDVDSGYYVIEFRKG